MTTKIPLFFGILCFLLLSPASAAQPDLLSFADSLAVERDYYRAITEYKRFLHYFPADPRAAYAQLAIAENLLNAKRWLAADEALKKVWRHYPAGAEADKARRLYAAAAYRRGDYREAKQRYESLSVHSAPPGHDASYWLGLNELRQDNPEAARRHFSNLAPDLSAELQAELERYEQLPQKSPRLAAGLSALLPGAGQLYTERPRQAGAAFALNAVFIYGAVEAWQNENYAVSGILSLFELGWYGGNIYNAANNAHKYNRRQKRDFLERLQQRFDLSLGFTGGSPQLSATIRF